MNVAFLIYRRPDLTRQVFAEIAKARPARLLVVADGPRNEEERSLCERTREVVQHVDWPCEVRRNYSESNLGCKVRVSSGLDWVFQEVDEAIILEDDCLPHPTFFRFCEELLDRYREDPRIGHVGGSNSLQDLHSTRYSYSFSRFTHIWGWATWKRVWQEYDVNMTLWPDVRADGMARNLFASDELARLYEEHWAGTYSGEVDTWDYQWQFCRLVHGSLAVVPAVNLVSNIGCGSDATHVIDPDNPRAGLPARAMTFPLHHPPYTVCDDAADEAFAKRFVFRRNRPVVRLARRLKNRHFYGGLVRRIPIAGDLWTRWRKRRSLRTETTA